MAPLASDERHVSAAAKDLGLSWVPQRLDGGVRLPGANRAPSGGERLAPCGPGALRMEGGYAALANALAATLPAGALHLGAEVTSIERRRVSGSGGGGGGGGGGEGGEGVRVTAEMTKTAAAAAAVAADDGVIEFTARFVISFHSFIFIHSFTQPHV